MGADKTGTEAPSEVREAEREKNSKDLQRNLFKGKELEMRGRKAARC